MNRHRSHSVSEPRSASKGLFQAQNVYIQGGTFNSAGNQHNYYGGGSAVDKPATYEQVQLALKDVPNYRDIHGANLSKATKGTGPKFDEWKEYCEWLIPGGKVKTMWGTGMPGAGKTIFAAIALSTVEAHAKASREPICVAYIYFRYSDHTKATTHDFLEVLVKQTLERQPECRPIACEFYARHIQEKTRPSDEELLSLLQKFTGMMLVTFYFLDAVDEAPPDVQLDLLEKLSSLNVQLFITSRPMDALQARFSTAHKYPIRAQDHDLDLHINKEISRSVILQDILNARGPELRERITTKVKEKCGGMFLHASLQLDALRHCTNVHGLEKVLDSFPPRIEDVYKQTWERICDQPPDNAAIGKNTLLWVFCAERSLDIDELRRFVAACPETHRIDTDRMLDERTLMGLCRGLVAVEEGTQIVRFVHYTAKDAVKQLISQTNPHPHSVPTQVCLELLVKHGFQRGTIDSDAALDQALAQHPPLRYAYEAWSFHAKQSLGDHAAVARLAEFIQGCSSFPVYLQHPWGPRQEWDCFQPLHMVYYFDLPVSLAGSASLREPDLPSSKKGFTPLMLAVIQKSIARVEELLTQPHINVNATSSYGETALLLASWPDREDIICLLLNQPHINPNQAQHNSIPPLTLASEQNECRGAVRLLLAHSEIDVNHVSERGATALMDAAVNGCYENVQLLLTHPRIKVNMVDEEGESALIMAAQRGNKDIVECLLGHPEIDVNLVDKRGSSAADYCRGEEDLDDIVQLILSRSQVQDRSSEVAPPSPMATPSPIAPPASVAPPTRASARARISRVVDRASTFLRSLPGR